MRDKHSTIPKIPGEPDCHVGLAAARPPRNDIHQDARILPRPKSLRGDPAGGDVAIWFSLMPCPCSGRSLPISMGRWRAAPVGHPWRFPCALRRVQGKPFLRRIPGTESSRLAHFAVKLVRFDSAGGIPPRLMGNDGEVRGIASSLCLPIAMDAPRARKALRPAGFGRDLSLRSCVFALSPRFARALLGRWRAAPVGVQACDRANVGLTWGWKTRHPIKVPHGAER